MPQSDRRTKTQPAGRFHLSLSRDGRARSLSLRPSIVYAGVALAPLIAGLSLAGPLYWCFGDEVIANLVLRQGQMQYAYEDRISALRSENEAAQQQDRQERRKLEERLSALASRQARAETRTETLSGMLQATATPRVVSPSEDTRAPIRTTTVAAGLQNPLLAPRPPKPLPFGATAYAPLLQPMDSSEPIRAAGASKPHPEVEVDAPPAKAGGPHKDLQSQLENLNKGIDRVERQQTTAVLALGAAARVDLQRLRAALQSAGLSEDRFTPGNKNTSVGGPFIPLDADANGTPFQKAVAHVEDSLGAAAQLQGLIGRVPFGKPLSGDLEVTSPFGYRVDPFFGRAALHSGVDLRDPAGSPVRATAAGKVVNASWSGGYGNMVEIDHGSGLQTRYGHLSAILVSDGQTIEAGALIGRVGSTGRSTGSHLHYEVRIDGEPVDPLRFLNSGARLTMAAN